MKCIKRLSIGIEADYRAFYWIMTAILAFMYVTSIVSNPTLHTAGPLILFTLVFNLHIALHWMLASIHARGWTWAYVLVQGVLGFWLVVLSNNLGMTFAVFLGLIGEVFGLLKLTPGAWGAAVFYLILSLVNFTRFLGIKSAGWWVLGMLSIVLFTAIYTILYRRQADARERAQELLQELEAANRQLREYATRVEDLTIAAERRRMARELHDTLSQGLAGLILQMEAVDAHLTAKRPGRAREVLRQSMEKARQTLAEARRAIDNLRQPASCDLAESLRREADHFASSTDIPCNMELFLPADVPEEVTEAAQRAVAEGLTNIARHAGAKNVSLRATKQEEMLEIVLQDDGMGFDPVSVDVGHYGLLGMRERVRLAGGSLEVQSAPGQGTRIVIRLPLERPADE